MIIGLLELVQTDLDGNVLAVSRGHNIMFDSARVVTLLNPTIIDASASFRMYFSDFEEKVLTTYTYWDSSVLTSYASSTITVSGPEILDRNSNQPQDILTYLYTFTSLATLPGSTAKTLRVVGLYYPTSSMYCTAVTLNNPIDHGITTYVTGYYKLILGMGEESTLFGNVFNWINRTWYSTGSNFYKKGFNFATNSNYNRNTYAAVASLATRTQSAYDSLGINTGISQASLLGAKMKDGNPSEAFLIKDITSSDTAFAATASKSRVFLHASGATDFYGNLASVVPTSIGSIRVSDIETFELPTVDCITITKSGAVGAAEYNVTMYPHALTDNIKFTEKLLTFYSTSTTTAGYPIYTNWIVYVSKSRNWSVATSITYSRSPSDGYYFTPVRSGNLTINYRGLARSYNLNSATPVQDNGVINNNGILFYCKTSGINTLLRYDFNKLYEEGYAEESQALSSSTEVRGYQVDEEANKVIVPAWEVGSELVTNGTFNTNTSGWTAEANVTLSVSSGTLVMTMSASHVSPFGCYQDVPTVIGKRYRVTIQYVGATQYNYYQYWRLDVGGTTVITPNLNMSVATSENILFTTYTALFTATSITTRIRICDTYGGIAHYQQFDNVSMKEVVGKIVKFDADTISSFTEYNISNPNFSALSPDSLLFYIGLPEPTRWYWRAGQGKVVWLGSLTSSKKLHYWDGTNTVEIYTEATAGSVIDVCVTEDFQKICYAVQNGTTCTWFIRSLADGSRWNLLYSIARTITGKGGCFVSDNWMYELSGTFSWGYRVNLVSSPTPLSEPWPIYAGPNVSYTPMVRLLYLPNRSLIPGALMYNFYAFDTYYGDGYPTYSWIFLDVSPLNFGWTGTQWIHNYSGNKITNDVDEDLPFYGTIGFGDQSSGVLENYVFGEYYTFAVNPNGYVFDNTMAYTAYPWVYSGVPQYNEELGISLMYPTPPGTPDNIPFTVKKAAHPDFLCLEVSSPFTKVIFDGSLVGKQVSSIYNLSYFGEYCINTSTGVITFYKDCNGHTVDIKYYWIRRDV